MKTFRIFFLAALCVACSSTEDDNTEKKVDPTGPKTYVMTIEADKGNDTRALSLDDKTLNSTWAQGEEVTVYNVTKSADISGSLVAQSSGASTTLKGTLTGTIEKGDELKLKFLSPNYESQAGTLEYIAANCDYAEATVTVASVDGGNIMTTGTAAFANQQAIVKFVLKDAGNSPLSTSSLKVSNYANSCTVTLTPASSEIYVAIPGISSTKVSLTASVGLETYIYEKTGVTLENSKYYVITVKMNKRPAYLSATSDAIGKVTGVDGNLYNTKSEATAAGAPACAVIAYVGSEGSVETGTSYKGLAIALNDCSNSNCTWQADRSSKSSVHWCNQNSVTCTSIQTVDIEHALLLKNGISMTAELTSHATHSHYAAIAASTYNVARPNFGASDWFLPSVGQWELIVQGLTGKSTPLSSSTNSEYYAGPVSAKITAAGGSAFSYVNQYGYWSCVEVKENLASYMNFYLGYTKTYNKKPGGEAGGYVRSVFAF